MKQAIDLAIENDGEACDVELTVHRGDLQESFPLNLSTGSQTARVFVADLRESMPAAWELSAVGLDPFTEHTTWKPTRHWQIHFVPLSHHDLGYTDLPSNVLREHDKFVDTVLDYCDETDNWPEASRFHYVIEQAWSALHYVEHRPASQTERLVKRLREGRIELTALFGNQITELCGHEEQIRLLYPSIRLKQRYQVPVRTAAHNDIPGISWGLAQILPGAGVRYLVAALPDYFAWHDVKVHTFWNEEEVLPEEAGGGFWWQGPDGNNLLFWFPGPRFVMWSGEQAERELPAHLDSLEAKGYPHDIFHCEFSGGWRDNSPPDLRVSSIARDWNQRWAFPRMVVGTNYQFCAQMEQLAGAELKTLRGEFPNTDYTIGALSTARETGINRLTHDQLLAAERLAVCAATAAGFDYPTDVLAEANDNALLFDEHLWSTAFPIGPAMEGAWSQKSQFAYRAAALSHDVLLKSANRLADAMPLNDDGYYLVVFNGLGQERHEVVRFAATTVAPCGMPMFWEQKCPGNETSPRWTWGQAIGRRFVDLPSELLGQPLKLVDTSTGKEVPHQVVRLKDPLAARPLAAERWAMGGAEEGYRWELVFVARELPSLGYRIYLLTPACMEEKREEKRSGVPPKASMSVSGVPSVRVDKAPALENKFYHIEMDARSGVVTSIYDKELQREWVDACAPYGFNQLVVRDVNSGVASVPSHSHIERGEHGPTHSSLIVRGDGLGCPQRIQEITLYHDLKRIEFANRLLKDASSLQEFYFAFPYAFDKPQFRFEGGNSTIEPLRDQLPGSNTDTYAVQHWVQITDGNGGITWSSLEAPVVVLSELWPGYVSQAHHAVTPPGYGHAFLEDPSQLTNGHIYSYIMAYNFRTNFRPMQVADLLFRYVMTSDSSESVRRGASAFGWSVVTPPLAVGINGPQAGMLPPVSAFFRVEPVDVALLALKVAEDGDGLIVRLTETAGRDVVATVELPHFVITEACLTNLVEENGRLVDYDESSFRVKILASGIVTVRCRGQRWFPTNTLSYYS